MRGRGARCYTECMPETPQKGAPPANLPTGGDLPSDPRELALSEGTPKEHRHELAELIARATAPAPRAGGADIPSLSIESAPGESYDALIRRLWTRLDALKLNPNEYPPGTDLHRLLIADAGSIDRIAHRVATDQKHQLLGTPPAGTMLTLAPDGNLRTAAQRAGARGRAPEREAPATPPPAPARPAPGALPPPPLPPFTLESRLGGAREPAPAPPPGAPGTLPADLVPQAPFTNRLGVAVDPGKGGVYLDTNGAAIAYAARYEERFAAAKAYARRHTQTSIWLQAEQPVEYPTRGTWHPWAFSVTYRGFFKGLEIALPPAGTVPPVSQMGRVDPDTFTRQLA